MELFIILTLEEEIGILRQNSSNVVMCRIDMEVLFCCCVSCCNFCLIMEMTVSTGTDVKRPSHHMMWCISLPHTSWIWCDLQSVVCSWCDEGNSLPLALGYKPTPWPWHMWSYPNWILWAQSKCYICVFLVAIDFWEVWTYWVKPFMSSLLLPVPWYSWVSWWVCFYVC